jgi:hypothetical protein
MTQHTPGPWYVGLREDQTIFTQNLRVASVECPRKEWKANARLIAAAPDMLAALQAIAASSTEEDAETALGSIQMICRAIITKAKGSAA